MRVKKAEEFLQSLAGDEYYLCKFDYFVLKQYAKIVEEGMNEKAVQSFCKTVCGDSNQDCGSCTLIKSFARSIITE